MFKLNPFSVVYIMFMLILPTVVTAADRPSTSVTPLGYALGSANRAAVEKSLRSKTAVKPNGTNRYSDGPMLLAEGNGLGVKGLRKALFIFDNTETLVAVQLSLDKGGLAEEFDRTYERLATKYSLKMKRVPFVGSKFARFEKGDAVIELDAPHLGSAMTVTYMTRGFEKYYKALSKKDALEKEKREDGQF